MQKLRFHLPKIESLVSFKLGGQNIALHAYTTARISAFLISTFSLYSFFFSQNFLQVISFILVIG